MGFLLKSLGEKGEGGVQEEPFLVMSSLLIGLLEYSLARAKRTSLLTICSCEVRAWVEPSSSPASLGLSSGKDASEAGGDGRRRVGGGDSEGSACCKGLGLEMVRELSEYLQRGVCD